MRRRTYALQLFFTVKSVKRQNNKRIEIYGHYSTDLRKLIEVAFFTTRIKRTVEFYEKFLGMKAEWTESGGAAVFMLGELKLFIHIEGAKAAPGYPPNVDHFAFRAADLNEACEEVRDAGLEVETGPKDFEWGRSAYLKDPDGRLVELHEE